MREPIRGWIEVPGEGKHSTRAVRAREDRATEADISAVERFLDEHEIWMGPKGEQKRDTAIELLGLILGEEASRV